MTGEIFVLRRTCLNNCTSSSLNVLAFQPRGLREKSCTVWQSSSFALSKAFCNPPLIGAWNPIRGLLVRPLCSASPRSRVTLSPASPFFDLLHFFHHSQNISPKNLINICFRITASQKLPSQVG